MSLESRDGTKEQRPLVMDWTGGSVHCRLPGKDSQCVWCWGVWGECLQTTRVGVCVWAGEPGTGKREEGLGLTLAPHSMPGLVLATQLSLSFSAVSLRWNESSQPELPCQRPDGSQPQGLRSLQRLRLALDDCKVVWPIKGCVVALKSLKSRNVRHRVGCGVSSGLGVAGESLSGHR